MSLLNESHLFGVFVLLVLVGCAQHGSQDQKFSSLTEFLIVPGLFFAVSVYLVLKNAFLNYLEPRVVKPSLKPDLKSPDVIDLRRSKKNCP
jgi:hypothetical protein